MQNEREREMPNLKQQNILTLQKQKQKQRINKAEKRNENASIFNYK